MTTFHIGLTMAGAISAGAYSGGVFDFICEALEAWEQEKQRLRDQDIPQADWPVPSHDVVIPVISGASAGSITGSVGLMALADGAPGALPKRHSYPQVGTVETRLPRLYAAWVQAPCFVSTTGGFLLGVQDIDGPQALPDGKTHSLLDATVLDHIARESIADFTLVRSRPYLAETMHLFVTVTNLQGIPYQIGFSSGDGSTEGYVMTSHADRVHFAIQGVGAAAFTSPWADPDPAIALDVATLPGMGRQPTLPWRGFLEATLASGGFPIGLRARFLPQTSQADLVARQWPITRPVPGTKDLFRLLPAYPATSDPSLLDQPRAALEARLGSAPPIDRVAVDGGMIDNEPFELARWTLMKAPPARNPREPNLADRAIIMIDPFPSEAKAAASLDASLVGVIRQLFPTLIDQARFKMDAVVNALDEQVKSRFLISPLRKKRRGSEPERYAIACGLLGGFGGFLNEEMRAHDYQLGRLNAHLFLKSHFGFPLTNQAIAAGYGPQARTATFEAASQEKVPGILYQMLPLVGSAADMPAPPAWPRAERAEVDALIAAACTRADRLAEKLITERMPAAWMRSGARTLWKQVGRSRLDAYIRWTVLKELHLRDQLAGLSADLNEAGRTVLAALADPAFDARTLPGIAKEYGITEEAVKASLARVEALVEAGPVPESWRLRERRPGFFGNLLSGRPTIG